MKKIYLVKTIAIISVITLLVAGIILFVVDYNFIPHVLITFKNNTVALIYNDQTFINLEDQYYFVDYDSFINNATPVRIGRLSLFSNERAYFYKNKYAFIEQDGLAGEYGVYINESLGFPELSTDNISYVSVIDIDEDNNILARITDPKKIKQLIVLYQESNDDVASNKFEINRFEVNFVFKDNILLFSTDNINDNLILEALN